MAFEIRNEEDFLAALEAVERDDAAFAEDGIRFVEWPRYEVTIRGEDFHGGVPTRVMPAFVRLQRALNRAYARNVYGDETKRLSQEERKRTELVIRLERGSTKFESDLGPALNSMVSNMSGTESVVAILGVVFFLSASWGLKAYLTHRAKIRQSDVLIRMSEEETARQERMAQMAERSMDLARQQIDMEEAQNLLMRGLRDDDELIINGEESISGLDARRLARQPRRERVPARIDGEFLIQAAESGQVQRGFRARVRDINGEQVLTIRIPQGVLPDEQMEELKRGEWTKTPIYMSINVQRIGERIVEADLIEAGTRPN